MKGPEGNIKRKDQSVEGGSILSMSASGVKVTKSKTLKVKDFKLSFNSSDIEAYKNENPIPVVGQAYLEYQRNKKKAHMRR